MDKAEIRILYNFRSTFFKVFPKVSVNVYTTELNSRLGRKAHHCHTAIFNRVFLYTFFNFSYVMVWKKDVVFVVHIYSLVGFNPTDPSALGS